jgi:hypothetical protein
VARLGIDFAVSDPMPGFLVELMEADFLAFGSRGIESDRTRDQRELEIALPIGTRATTYSYANTTETNLGDERPESTRHEARCSPIVHMMSRWSSSAREGGPSNSGLQRPWTREHSHMRLVTSRRVGDTAGGASVFVFVAVLTLRCAGVSRIG